MNNSQNEIEVMIPKGCDNAPRKQIMIAFTVACLKQDTDTIERYAHEAIVWEQLRENKIIEGLPSFNQALQVENDQTVTGL